MTNTLPTHDEVFQKLQSLGAKIYVIDDEPDITLMLKYKLQPLTNLEVIQFSTVQAVQSHYQQHGIDELALMYCDNDTPGNIEGKHFLAETMPNHMKNGRFPLYAVMMTANSEAEHDTRVAGTETLAKPFNMEEIDRHVAIYVHLNGQRIMDIPFD